MTTPKKRTKHVKILADKHTHAGRDYPRGAVIRDLDADSADWLIGLKRAEEVSDAEASAGGKK